VRVGDQMLADRAEQHPGEPLQPSGADDQQVGSLDRSISTFAGLPSSIEVRTSTAGVCGSSSATKLSSTARAVVLG
jgi:hypothetical protein